MQVSHNLVPLVKRLKRVQNEDVPAGRQTGDFVRAVLAADRLPNEAPLPRPGVHLEAGYPFVVLRVNITWHRRSSRPGGNQQERQQSGNRQGASGRNVAPIVKKAPLPGLV